MGTASLTEYVTLSRACLIKSRAMPANTVTTSVTSAVKKTVILSLVDAIYINTCLANFHKPKAYSSMEGGPKSRRVQDCHLTTPHYTASNIHVVSIFFPGLWLGLFPGIGGQGTPTRPT